MGNCQLKAQSGNANQQKKMAFLNTKSTQQDFTSKRTSLANEEVKESRTRVSGLPNIQIRTNNTQDIYNEEEARGGGETERGLIQTQENENDYTTPRKKGDKEQATKYKTKGSNEKSNEKITPGTKLDFIEEKMLESIEEESSSTPKKNLKSKLDYYQSKDTATGDKNDKLMDVFGDGVYGEGEMNDMNNDPKQEGYYEMRTKYLSSSKKKSGTSNFVRQKSLSNFLSQYKNSSSQCKLEEHSVQKKKTKKVRRKEEIQVIKIYRRTVNGMNYDIPNCDLYLYDDCYEVYIDKDLNFYNYDPNYYSVDEDQEPKTIDFTNNTNGDKRQDNQERSWRSCMQEIDSYENHENYSS